MRNLMLACATLAIVAGGVSVNLWRERHADRELIAELRMKLNEAEQRGGSPATVALPPAAETSAAAVPATTRPFTSAMPANPATAPGPGTTVSYQREMLKDPEHRKARLAQLRLVLPQSYPGLAEALALSPEEAEKFWDVLAENQLERSANGTPLVNGRIDPQAAQEMGRTLQELQRSLDESLAAMLGNSRFQQWQDYRETQPSRQRAMQVGRTLEASGEPLNDAQMRNLTTALIADQRQRQTLGPRISSSDAQNQAQLQAENNRRVIEAATPYLSARQLEALRASLER